MKLLNYLKEDKTEEILQQIILNKNLSELCDKVTDLILDQRAREKVVTKNKVVYYFEVLEEYFSYNAS